MSAPERVQIYTDGACSGNPGPGGWAAILSFKGSEKEISGGEEHTTNNRMELRAAIEGLKSLKRGCAVDLYTDSQYVRQGITSWMANWKRRGWRTADNKPVKNEDLVARARGSGLDAIKSPGTGSRATPTMRRISGSMNSRSRP